MEDDDAKPKSKVGTILFWLAFLGGLGWLIPKAMQEANTPFKQKQREPETALRLYAETAYGYLHQTAPMDDLIKCVTEGDWEWFNQNAAQLQDDPFNLGGGLDPTQAAGLQRHVALHNLLNAGVNRGDFEILEKNLGDTEATFKVRKFIDQDTKEELTVRLMKVGKYWKMTDFAGGRAKFENRSDARMVSSSPGATAESGGAAEGAQTAGEISPDVDTEIGLARIAWDQKNYAAAIEHAEIAREIAEEDLPEGHPKLKEIDAMIAAARQAAGGGAPAAHAPPPQPAQVSIPEVETAIEAARVAWDFKDYNGAIQEARKARGVAEQRLSKDHPKLAQIDAMIKAAEAQLAKTQH